MRPSFYLSACFFLALPLAAQDANVTEETTASPQAQVLDTIVISAESESKPVIQGPFLPDVLDGKIFAGKKTSVIDFDSLPQIQTDNYRQAFSKTPGLLVSELPNNSMLSIGSRGIGDPHESQDILVLKDGVPFVMDMFGYPSVYYAPPLEAMDRMEFVRGGSSLLYGPQPAGSLNYISHRPSLDKPFEFSTQNLIGSNNFYSNYTSVDGTIGRLSYMINYNHRSGQSFRTQNSDFELNGGTIMLGLDLDKSTRWLLDIDLYHSDAGEPGGLNFLTGGGNLNYNQDRDQAQFLHNRIVVQRQFATLALEHDFSEATQMRWKVFGGSSTRTSYRQAAGFGTLPTSGANLTNEHQYRTIGTDLRFNHAWMAWGDEHHLTAGMTATYTHAPIFEYRGFNPTDEGGVTLLDALRTSTYVAFFVENQFKFGRFSIIPAVRFETVHQELTDNVRRANSAGFPAQPLRQREDNQDVPLGAIGLAYDLTDTSSLYFNLSQGYKPPTYADALPRNSNVTNTDLDPGHTLTYELGYRSQPSEYINWDISGFFIDYQDRFGTVGAGAGQTVQNVGHSQNWGLDIASEIDLIGIWGRDQAAAESLTKRFGNLGFHVAYEWLNASFVDGPVDGKEPQFSPEHLLRFGLTYRWRDRFKISLLHTYVSQHYANDSNDANFNVPAYHVTDLTAEAKLWKENVTLLAGINNLFDEDYYSRIRATGIDPAYGRNFYVGLRFNY